MSDTPKDKNQERDERAFNETLKRMLETPPKPHDKAGKEKQEGDRRSSRQPVSNEDDKED